MGPAPPRSTPAPADPLRQRLRAATAAAHERIEALPFFEAAQSRQLPLGAYVELLRTLRPVRAALEDLLPTAADPRLRGLWAEPMRRLPALDRDLATLDAGPSGPLSVPAVRGLVIAHTLRLGAERDPPALAGYAYVLEGATEGGRVLAAQLAPGLELSPDRGLAFLTSASPVDWPSLVARLDALPLTEAEADRAIAAAVSLFEQLHGAFDALHPLREPDRWGVLAELNPDAGTHPITEDPIALEAALRAGERSWAAFPYYAARYGERGRAFTRSDSAWLTSLCRRPPDRAIAEVIWLGTVLASRGMPQWLLETHLRVLHDELLRAAPAADAGYANLTHASDALRRLRLAHVGDTTLDALAVAFRRRAPTDEVGRLPEAGALIAAAVADERLGLRRAVPSLVEWLTDATRFSPGWIRAVTDTLAQARAVAAGRQP